MPSRLDIALVERKLVRSRNQGREFIRAGQVEVDGEVCRKPAREVAEEAEIELLVTASTHRVGRGYDKLRAFLAENPVDFKDRFVIDGGASTGGFTQVALEGGATEVLAVELGRDQLAEELRNDPRVRSLEQFDIRNLVDPGAECDILMLDLSFISLKEVVPVLQMPFAPAAVMIALVKPQFELPAKRLRSSGVVRFAKDSEKALAKIIDCLTSCGWTVEQSRDVQPGPDQINREFLVLARRRATGG